MKKYFLTAALGLIALSTTLATPAEGKVSYRVSQSFTRDFGNPGLVTWSEARGHLLKASFEADGQTVCAFYRQDGEYVATTITMQRQQLPLKARLAVDKALSGYTLTEIFELQTPSETAYYIKGTRDGITKVYKAYAGGGITEVHLSQPF